MKAIERDIPAKFSDLLYTMDELGASDAQLHPDQPVWYRKGGTHIFAPQHTDGIVYDVSEADITDWVSYTAGDVKDPLGDDLQISRAVDVGDFRARATFRDSVQGTTASIRLVPREPPTCDELGVPLDLQALTKKTSGLVIVEGPTGSGKTTLLNALLDKVNKESDRHIYTIEDPVEFVHRPIGATTIVNREVGYHVKSYPEAVKDALRSKPDVIYMGELRDPETVKSALHAATTGHLVFTTAHAGSVTEAIQSFIGQFSADEQPQIRQRFAMSLLAVICQKLVRTTNPDAPLTAAQEVMFNNRSFQDMILKPEAENQIHAQLDSNNNDGWSMERSLAWLTIQGVITREEALTECKDEKRYEQQIIELKNSSQNKEQVAEFERVAKEQAKAKVKTTPVSSGTAGVPPKRAAPSRLSKRFG